MSKPVGIPIYIYIHTHADSCIHGHNYQNENAICNSFSGNLPTSPSNGQHGVFPVNTDTNGAFSIPGQPYLYPSAHHFSQHSALYAAHHAAHMQWLHHMAQVMQGVPYMPVQQPM